MKNITAKDLKNIEALHEVPEQQLQWMIDESEIRLYNAGDYLFKPGDSLFGVHIILEGLLELYLVRNTNKSIVAEFEAGAITGILPFSRAQIATGYGLCIKEATILSFPQEKLKEMIAHHYELTQALVHIMTNRVRDFAALQQQNEKMMALGKLSAGLAHELNNPASAIVRGSSSLKHHLQLQPDTFKKVISIKMTAEAIDCINKRMYDAMAVKERPVLTMMQKSAKEDEIEDWLLDNNVNELCDIAENFVAFDFGLNDLEDFKKVIPADNLEAVLLWINSNLVTERMVADIEESSKRIAHLVGSVKTFTHMDGGSDKQLADIHTGIRNTLVMLNHKIKKNNIKVIEDFEEGIPKIKIMIGELNQVWTNLIDNATDALENVKDPTLTIQSKKDNNFVRICIKDNGPGIPDEIKSLVFDPFFTTKEIGKGTGLGLDVVARIVKQHQGTVKVNSKPGETIFEVCLPINN